MKELPEEIKATYILAVAVMMLFVGFIIFVLLMYNRKQLLHFKEKQLKESEYQNRLLQKELEKQKSIEKERERISHDMHDDLGAGISALKLHSEFLKQKVSDHDLLNDIDELLKTSEEMNISMREMLWSLNSENDTLERFIDYVLLYSGNFLKKTKIVLKSECIDIIADTPISTELRRNFFLCLKEALNNTYKHSQADILKLSFSQEKNIFTMKVSDNGKGIPEECHKGNGLTNMKRRMDELNGELSIFSEKPGTCLLFKIIL